MGSLPTCVYLHPTILGRITGVFCQRDSLHPTLGFSEQHPLKVQALDFSPGCHFSQAISRMLHETVVSSFFFFFFLLAWDLYNECSQIQ